MRKYLKWTKVVCFLKEKTVRHNNKTYIICQAGTIYFLIPMQVELCIKINKN